MLNRLLDLNVLDETSKQELMDRTLFYRLVESRLRYMRLNIEWYGHSQEELSDLAIRYLLIRGLFEVRTSIPWLAYERNAKVLDGAMGQVVQEVRDQAEGLLAANVNDLYECYLNEVEKDRRND